MDEHQKIASQIFEQHGLKFKTAERAGGWTNAVWYNGDFVLRLSLSKNSDRIRREVELAGLLPQSVGYPTIITTGVTHGYEWSFSNRIRGKNLSDVWNNLSLQEKAKAVEQILDMMKAIHSIDVHKAEHLSLRRAWYNPFIKNESIADIERYVSQEVFTAQQGNVLCGIIENFYQCLENAEPVLNHGDITMDNILWHEGEVVSLMDFEHSSISPSQLDLHSIINLALVPDDVLLIAEHKKETEQYIDDMINLFRPMLTQECDKDLLLGYAILFRQRFLEFWLNAPKGELHQVDAYQKILSLCDGDGGYLFELIK